MPMSFTFDPEEAYVVDFRTALIAPSIFEADNHLGRRTLIISPLYQQLLAKKRKRHDDKGESANRLSRAILGLLQINPSIMADGVNRYEKGDITLIVDNNDRRGYTHLSNDIRGKAIRDAICLAAYWNANGKSKLSNKVELLTNDQDARLAAQGNAVCIRDYEPEIYLGWRIVKDEKLRGLWKQKGRRGMALAEFNEYLPNVTLNPHEFVFFTEKIKGEYDMIGRYDASRQRIVPLTRYQRWEYTTPLNHFQAIAMEAIALPTEECKAIILIGPAGCGKTRLSVSCSVEAAGLFSSANLLASSEGDGSRGRRRKDRRKADRKRDKEHLQEIRRNIAGEEETEYDEKSAKDATFYQGKTSKNPTDPLFKRIVAIPPQRMLGDHATLPGDNKQKYGGFVRQNKQCLMRIIAERKTKKPGGRILTEIEAEEIAERIAGQMEIVPTTEMSGDTYIKTGVLMDEAHFLSAAELRGSLGRIDQRSHAIYMGDPTQGDNRYDWYKNPIVSFSAQHAENPGVAIIWWPYDPALVQRPGGVAAMFGIDRII